MALQISFTDKRGVANTEAYVRINSVDLSLLQNSCEFDVHIYHNATARSKSDADQRKQAVFHITYTLWGDTFNTYLADSVLKQNEKSLLSQLYTWLKLHQDLATMTTDDRFNHGNNINWTTATDV